MTEIEKLVEECDALILNCSGDTRMMARAVIRRALEFADEVAAQDVIEASLKRSVKGNAPEDRDLAIAVHAINGFRKRLLSLSPKEQTP